MIPSTIASDHIKQASEWIKGHGVPKGKEADKFLVLVDGEWFPPKYLLSIAGWFATGNELDAADFTGSSGLPKKPRAVSLGCSVSAW